MPKPSFCPPPPPGIVPPPLPAVLPELSPELAAALAKASASITPEPPPAPAPPAQPPPAQPVATPTPTPAAAPAEQTDIVDLREIVYDWIAVNTSPEEVFSREKLITWAHAQGYYTKEEIVSAIVQSLTPRIT